MKKMDVSMSIGKDGKTWDQYIVGGNGIIQTSVCPVTATKLPANVYQIFQGQEGQMFFMSKTLAFDNIIPLPDMNTNFVLNDLNTFWKGETKRKYEELGLVYKRGILMYGKAGTGKTLTVISLAKDIIEQGGIVIYNPDPSVLSEAIKQVRSIEGIERKLLVVFEEFDYIVDNPHFLSLLDGELQIDNVAYLATTNHIENIPDRIKNRPGRFARKIEIGLPSYNDRLAYVTAKLKHLGYINADLEEFAIQSEGLVIDQLRDVIISFHVYNETLENAIGKAKSVSYEIEKEECEDAEDELYDKLEKAGVI
jgi:hypothetical protein